MAKVIIFGNQKGGVAKTTSTYNVATQLALKGYRVLMANTIVTNVTLVQQRGLGHSPTGRRCMGCAPMHC